MIIVYHFEWWYDKPFALACVFFQLKQNCYMTLYLSYSLRFATVIVVLGFHVNIFASLIQRLALKFSHTCTSSVFEEDEIKKKKRNALHFNNRDQRSSICLHSQFKIVTAFHSKRTSKNSHNDNTLTMTFGM